MEYKTKDRLGEALQDIAENDQFDDITVKQIVQESHVNRQTFYYHFQDKYDCLHYQFSHDAEKLTANTDSQNWLVTYLSLFRYIDTYQNFCRHVVDSHAYLEFDDFILKTIDLIVEKIKKSLEDDYPRLAIRNQAGLRVFEYGHQGVVSNWFRGGLRENPALLVEGMSKFSQQQLTTLFDHPEIDLKTSFKQQLEFV
ncbi:TetR/AcrR family transcriptional regulator C-terminal domain-containing protein [Levilactobacillus tangyuanensis]|uniref:TetR/AcrR family transcriptional regulator C-terminal domain-containing protein n=1 Tax=Levilactobacillus tangyuanensis TaxID=2486021 RepID=A0ABW1TP38_9LACO|nr:TetR/AcrR family transcriptional regulator C-terminal domain-containing protein [Levilactobacillus tangyuanensis]